MLVDTENPPESKPEAAAPAPAHSHLRIRSDLHEEYSSDEIAKMTELYEGTRAGAAASGFDSGGFSVSTSIQDTGSVAGLDQWARGRSRTPEHKQPNLAGQPRPRQRYDRLDLLLEREPRGAGDHCVGGGSDRRSR